MELVERYIALDVGTKRIGTAISDPFGIFASELELVSRIPENRAISRIIELCEKHNVTKLVVGVPYNTEGEIGSQAEDCINFANKFKPEFEIIFVDESMTSYEAEKILQKQKKRYTKNKGMVDLMSARLILTEFLNNRSN